MSMVGCGGNTAPPSTEHLPTTVSETIITEITDCLLFQNSFKLGARLVGFVIEK